MATECILLESPGIVKALLLIVQATPAMSTSRISILSFTSQWFFIPNIFSLYIFAFQLRLCQKTVNMKQRVSRGDFSCRRHIFYYICYCLCRSQNSALTRVPYSLLWLCTYITWGAKTSQTTAKTVKVVYLLSTEQLILYLAQLNP